MSKGELVLYATEDGSPLLKGAGRMSHDTMVKIAHERYEAFDGQRRKAEAAEADAKDLKALTQVDHALTKKGGKQ